jgi:hypothetical protein
MSDKPVFFLPVETLAGPGNRWMKIINLLSKKSDFEFKLMIPKALYKAIEDLKTYDSEEFMKLSPKKLILVYNYNYKILNVLEYFIKSLFLRLRGYNTIHSIMGVGFSLRLKKFLRFKINYEVVGPGFADILSRENYIEELDKIICVSDTVAKRVLQTKNELVHKRIMTYPIPFYNSISKDYGDKKKEDVIVFAHNYRVKRKNAIMCAFLFNEISKIKPEWKFYFLGKGVDGYDSYKSYINYILSDCENVIFDYYEDIYPILDISKIFLSLNSINNYPSQSILESMHCKNALVVTNTGQSAQFIRNNGVLVDTDYNSVKTAILTLMDDDQLFDKCQNSKKLLESRFAPSIFINSLVDLYS